MGNDQSNPTPPPGKYRLTYFNGHGRAFPIRVALHAAGMDFEDERVEFPKLVELRGGQNSCNERIPLGSLPVLTLPDGKVITQSLAITRYVSKFSGLYPQDPRQALTVDEVIDTIDDLSKSIPRSDDKEKLKELREAWMKEKAPRYMEHINKRIQESGGPFVLGEKFSMADLYVWGGCQAFTNGFYDHMDPNFPNQYKFIKQCADAVEKHPIVVSSGQLAKKA